MRDKSIYIRLLITFSVILILIFLCVLFLKSLIDMFAPFLIALLFSWALYPLVRFAASSKLKLSHTSASAICVAAVFMLAGALFVWIIAAVMGELISFADNWENIWGGVNEQIENFLSNSSGIIDQFPRSISFRIYGIVDVLSEGVFNAVDAGASALETTLAKFKKALPSVIMFLIAFGISAFIISKRFPGIRRWYLKKTNDDSENVLSALVTIVKSAFGGYLRATLIVASVVGAVTLAAFLIMRVKYALLLAVLMAVLDILPYVGAGIVIFPWAVVSIIAGNYGNAVTLIITYVAILIVRNVLLPKVLGNQAGVSPLISLAGVFFGFNVGGIWGMIWGPIVVIVLAGVIRSGIFSGIFSDLKVVFRDIRIKLRES